MNKRKKIGILTLFCMSCIVFLFSGYMFISNIAKYRAAADTYQDIRTALQRNSLPISTENPAEEIENETKTLLPELNAEPPKPLVSMDFSDLQEINPEIVGWIKCEGADIDYPVMQTDNNSYYLTHLYNGEYNSSGAIFMDYRSKADFSDKNTIIYGHNMKNSTMFGNLKKYKNQDFYADNPTMKLLTPHGDYLIELISGTVEDGNYEFVRFDLESNKAFLDYVEELRSRSTFTSDANVRVDDKIICFCTCSYEWNNARYMVVGRKLRLYQP